MFKTRNSSLKLAVATAFVVMASGAFAQKLPDTNYKQPETKTFQSGSNYKKPNCPVTYVDDRCLPPKQLPQAASVQDCECEIVRVNSHGRTLWVRNCYLQLPNKTVFYCKPTPHLNPQG